MAWLQKKTSRRRFLFGLTGAAAAFTIDPRRALAGRAPFPPAAPPPPEPRAVSQPSLKHFAWVWQFQHAGSRDEISDVLAEHNLGIVLKTHDGTEWMSEYDDAPDAVSGPGQVASLAASFEGRGVPFHAWCVVNGEQPEVEARMAADVLSAGARSLFIDLEAHAGFWRGTTDGARAFGEELRRLRPDAWLSTSVDSRPWEIGRIPLAEFAEFTDEISPQIYWGAFDTPENIGRYRREGEDPGAEGMTPRFVLAAAARRLRQFDRPVHPIGDGTVRGDEPWSQFLDEAFAHDAEAVSLWRLGVAGRSVLELLKATPPRPLTHTVQPGDALSVLAERWHSDVATVAALNGIDDPNLIWIGQRLRIPGRAERERPILMYTVQPGDNLWYLAGRWGTTVDEIVRANNLANPDLLRIGDRLRVP